MFSKKDLQRLIIPMIIEQFLVLTIGISDTVMVATVGEAAVSGVALVDSINVLIINIFAALATGGSVVCAQFLGRQDDKNAKVAAKQLILVTTGLSILIMAICLMAQKGILSMIFGNVEPAVMSNALTYFSISAMSYPFIALYNAGAALFRSMGNSKVSMMTSFIMNVINISVNAILIFGFDMGVMGAAIGSLVSRATSAVIVMLLIQQKSNRVHITKLFKLDVNTLVIRNILSVGIPNGIENGMFQIGKILVQGLIASFGTIAIAANAVANSVVTLAVIPGMAIGLAMITVVGQCVGAGDYDQARHYMLKLTKITYIAMGILNIGFFLGAPYIVTLFNLLPETAELARKLILWHSIFCILLWPASFTFPNGLRAANDVKFTMLVSILSMWTFRIFLSYFLGSYLGMGVMGVWIAMTVDWGFRIVAFAFRFFSGKWKEHALI